MSPHHVHSTRLDISGHISNIKLTAQVGFILGGRELEVQRRCPIAVFVTSVDGTPHHLIKDFGVDVFFGDGDWYGNLPIQTSSSLYSAQEPGVSETATLSFTPSGRSFLVLS